MKLKKIASLALAGIMAVSMLAGCKGTGSSSSDSTIVTPVDNSIAAYVNSELNDKQKAVVTFTYDSEVEAAVEKVAGSLRASDVANADTWIATDVLTSFREAMDATVGIDGFTGGIKDVTGASVLVVNGTYTEAAMKDLVVKKLAEFINTSKMPANSGNGNYKYDYAGKIGMTKITNTEGTYSAYVIGVVIDQTVTEQQG